MNNRPMSKLTVTDAMQKLGIDPESRGAKAAFATAMRVTPQAVTHYSRRGLGSAAKARLSLAILRSKSDAVL